MELASMLAGEPFTDHPRSVSPTIAAFLRHYNDVIDDERRQDLYAYAAKIVGTAAPIEVEHARVERLVSWADEMWHRSSRWSLAARMRRKAARRAMSPGSPTSAAAHYATRAIGRLGDDTHRLALELVDRLIDLRCAPDDTSPAPAASSAPGASRPADFVSAESVP